MAAVVVERTLAAVVERTLAAVVVERTLAAVVVERTLAADVAERTLAAAVAEHTFVGSLAAAVVVVAVDSDHTWVVAEAAVGLKQAGFEQVGHWHTQLAGLDFVVVASSCEYLKVIF